MNWIKTIRKTANQFLSQAQLQASLLLEDLPIVADLSQMNRRTRRAWRSGRMNRATYLLVAHQRRRLARRREIRALIGE